MAVSLSGCLKLPPVPSVPFCGLLVPDDATKIDEVFVSCKDFQNPEDASKHWRGTLPEAKEKFGNMAIYLPLDSYGAIDDYTKEVIKLARRRCR